MTKKTVIYFHSLSSPWAYLGGPRFHKLVEKYDLDVILRPTTIVQENGGIPLLTRPDPRRSYHELELDRWRKRLDMPLVLRPKYYPSDPQFSARMVMAADQLGLDALTLSHALLHALWSEEKDVRLPEVRQAVADGLGMDGAMLVAKGESDQIKADWKASHEEAITHGVFGTPTYIYNGERFWGQDRLDFLDERLAEG
ncbi:2-hydroxychromene-2-carboxylate isomerase [Alphaproteobacteria bacterium HT1-32]|nr:2-hydroxychromene-2-carboxylate isomerase [Alphaproteobacteria bacterium HT1-32]